MGSHVQEHKEDQCGRAGERSRQGPRWEGQAGVLDHLANRDEAEARLCSKRSEELWGEGSGFTSEMNTTASPSLTRTKIVIGSQGWTLGRPRADVDPKTLLERRNCPHCPSGSEGGLQGPTLRSRGFRIQRGHPPVHTCTAPRLVSVCPD